MGGIRVEIMSIWFSDDIRNALLAANEGGQPSLEQIRELLVQSCWSGEVVERAYREGHKAALVTIAIAFGLSPAVIASNGEQQARQVVARLDNHSEM